MPNRADLEDELRWERLRKQPVPLPPDQTCTACGLCALDEQLLKAAAYHRGVHYGMFVMVWPCLAATLSAITFWALWAAK